jgi:hypothetical protein
MIPETEVNFSVACRNNGPDLQQEVETLRREVAALRLQHHLVRRSMATFSLKICAFFVCLKVLSSEMNPAESRLIR